MIMRIPGEVGAKGGEDGGWMLRRSPSGELRARGGRGPMRPSEMTSRATAVFTQPSVCVRYHAKQWAWVLAGHLTTKL